MTDPIYITTMIAALYGAAYVVAASLFLRLPLPRAIRGTGFAFVNVIAVWAMFFAPDWTKPWISNPASVTRYSLYLLMGVVHLGLLKTMERNREGWLYTLALWTPIAALVVVKIETAWQLVGISYMTFRMAQAAMEMRRNPELQISFMDYLGFLFFPPTIPVGPISPFRLHVSGLETCKIHPLTIGRGMARILIGLVMYKFLAPIPQQMSFANLWTDGYTHGVGDFLISSYAYLLYLFFNFAGACHIAIGVAALIGIPVKENFNNPFLARNIKDFWNRWHISLSEFVRDLIFTPVTLGLMRILGPAFAVPVTVLAAMLTFTIIGIWHGSTIGFLIFGALHGLGFCIHFLFETALRKFRLLRNPFFASAHWNAFAVSLTLTYIALTMIFVEFQNLTQLRNTLAVFAW